VRYRQLLFVYNYSLDRKIKETNESIKAFQKATDLDPNFTYGHTLLGHEYLANDDLDLASQSFKKALSTNPRHYSAL
jgi:anaphase-promoting complex subunit 3